MMDPRFLTEISKQWTKTCTIQRVTTTQTESGEEIPTWTNLTGHIGIACAIGPAGGREDRTAQLTTGVQMWQVLLAGYYPGILQKDRALISSVAYDIILSETGPEDGITRLTIRRVV